MKNILKIIVAAMGVMLFAEGCDSATLGTGQEAATGAPYELIVVADNVLWEGPVGDTLRVVCADLVPNLNEPEPRLDLMRVLPSAYKGFIKIHRNVLYLDIDPSVEDVKAIAEQDKFSDGQMFMKVTAPNAEVMTDFLSNYREDILVQYETAERDRALKMNNKHKEGVMVDKIRDMFGFHIDLPRGYTPRGTSGDSLLVTSFEYPTATQGIAVYSYPYENENDLRLDSLIHERNNFVKNIPGPSGKSYMTTVSGAYGPEISYRLINGRKWAEVRGFWNLEGPDFMGGPMINWTTLDEKNRRLITIDCYVYSPKDGQRDLVRGMEHLIYSVKFPEQ